MRAAEDLHVEWVDDEAVVLDPHSGHMHYLNPAAAFIYALIQEYGYEEAVRRLEEQFDPDAAVRRELDTLVGDMKSKGLLVDP